MMDFLFTNILMLATGVLVGRLFYKLNPFFMLFGLILGGGMLAFALERNIVYSFAMFIGFGYGIFIMMNRNRGSSNTIGTDGSLFSRVMDFAQQSFMHREARRFREREAEQDSAFDWFFRFRNHSEQAKRQAEEQAQQESERASSNERKYQQEQQQREREQEKYQQEAEQERQRYEQEKQQFEQEAKKKYQQKQQSEKAKPDTRTSYQILGVSEMATASEIKKSYQKLRTKYHPDKNMQMSESFRKECELEFSRIKHAYEILTGKKK